MRHQRFFLPLIILSSAILLLPFLGSAHLFDWDEINFAEASREMIVTGDYGHVQINYKPFREKPPLFFWLQVACMKTFGINEYAARLPNALAGILTVVALYYIGGRIKNALFGLVWALSYLSMMLPFIYFKSGVIDPIFNLFIFLSIYFVASSEDPEKKTGTMPLACGAGVLCGLAILTKGPVALLLVMLTFLIHRIAGRSNKKFPFKNILGFAVCCAVVSSLWFLFELIDHGPGFLVDFILYQFDLLTRPVAGHQQPIYYHWVVILIGCFPSSLFALPILIRRVNPDGTPFLRWMKILFWVVLILFSLVQTKIVHYSSQAYFPLSFMAALYIYGILTEKPAKAIIFAVGVTGGLIATAIMTAGILPQFLDKIIPMVDDEFSVACMRTVVHWSGYEFLIGLFFLIGIVAGCYCLANKRVAHGLLVLCYATTFSLLLSLKFILPKIENYTQGPEIRFFEMLAGQDVYVKAVGYWSYAPFFYGKKMPASPETDEVEWLLSGPIDKPAYFVCKVTGKSEVIDRPEIKVIAEEGGYILFMRAAVGDTKAPIPFYR